MRPPTGRRAKGPIGQARVRAATRVRFGSAQPSRRRRLPAAPPRVTLRDEPLDLPRPALGLAQVRERIRDHLPQGPARVPVRLLQVGGGDRLDSRYHGVPFTLRSRTE
jgi:hypothetical protein